jgi:hypothetical protein
MRMRSCLLIVMVGLLCLDAYPQPSRAWSSAAARTAPVEAAGPVVLSSPINAGCGQVAPTMCKLHVDPFTIRVGTNQRLVAFQLRANDRLLYDFSTDVSNPPMGNFTPSTVRLGFAASCGTAYTINLLARDTGDDGFLSAGMAENIVCPAGIYTTYLPVILR